MKTILLIEDDKFLLQLMQLALGAEGYQVTSACQGKDAVQLLATQAVDMIILDLMMPEMDGLGFLRWLRQETKLATPALVQTAMAKAGTEKQVMEAGATALIYKPIKLPELLDKVKQLEQFT